MKHRPCTITAPLPGWIRFQHRRTLKTLDINPANFDHQRLMPYYTDNPDWENITESFCDKYEEPKND